jgi:hypothetical protein
LGERPSAEFGAAVARLAAIPAWIMDGNYSFTYDLRMPIADAIVWLDLPAMRGSTGSNRIRMASASWP